MTTAVVRPRLVLAIVAAAAFFLSIGLTFVNVALPDIGDRFSASPPEIAWVVDAYTVALTGLLIPAAAVAERFGRRQVFIAGLCLFTASSVACGVAMSLEVMLAGRVAMGVGAGMMLAPAMAITAMAFAPGNRAGALATWASAGALGLALGPVIGGVVVGTIGWRWAFLLPVPLLLVAVAAAVRILPVGRGPDGVPLDVWGAGLALVALVPLVAAIIEGPRLGWTSPWVIGGLAAGVLLLTGFVARELMARHPAFDVRALRHPAVAGASLVLFASYVAFMGVLFLVTLELQHVAGVTPIEYGLLLLPMSVAYWVMSRVGAKVAAGGRSALALTAGLAAVVASFALPAFAPPSPGWAVPALILMGVGGGLLVPVASAAVLDALPAVSLGTSSALSVVPRFTGGAVGVAVIASAVSTVSAPASSTLEDGLTAGYRAGGITALILAVAAGLLLARGRRLVERRTGRVDDPGVYLG
jgi:DHA2 family methylenomycin A resistance protein-like MFS transporter